jgi:hypothetical protein
MRKKKLEPLTEMQHQISNLLYKEIGYMYCDNCRFNTELDEEQFEKENGYWGCDDCHRKYNGWGISRAECDSLARKIGEIKSE